MKKYILIFIFISTLNCTLNKVSNNHGYKLIEKKYDKIIIGNSNKNDVRKIIGPPSSISTFDDIWFYIERKKTNQSLIKLGKKKISKNNILIIEFNEIGLVSSKNILNQNDMNDIRVAEKKTFKKYGQDNFVYNLMSTLREKINAPTRRNR